MFPNVVLRFLKILVNVPQDGPKVSKMVLMFSQDGLEVFQASTSTSKTVLALSKMVLELSKMVLELSKMVLVLPRWYWTFPR